MIFPRLTAPVTALAILFCVLVFSVARPCSCYAGEQAATPVPVFELGEGKGSPYGFRIPALLTTQSGVLLAFCERRLGLHDHAENDIVLRRSLDGGKNWNPLQVVVEEGGDSLNDPCAILLDTGRILLRYTRFPKGVHSRNSSRSILADPGYGSPTNVRMYLTYSDDDGNTWGTPRDVTRAMRRESAVAVGSPGVGIQLTQGDHAGRLVFPNYEVYRVGNDVRSYSNSVSYSDDGGETWSLSDPIHNGNLGGYGDEAQLAELPGGGILISSRFGPNEMYRLLSVSRDGGVTWEKHHLAKDLLTPPCMASLIRYSWPAQGQPGLLLHTLPHTSQTRTNGTLMTSRDNGQTWQSVGVLVPGGFAYSCLTRLPDGDVGCLYEGDEYQQILFLRIAAGTFLHP